MTTVVVLFNLQEGVDPAEYEWPGPLSKCPSFERLQWL